MNYEELVRRIEIISETGKELKKVAHTSNPHQLLKEYHWKPITSIGITSLKELSIHIRKALNEISPNLTKVLIKSLPGLAQLVPTRFELLSKSSFPIIISIKKENPGIAKKWISTINQLALERKLIQEEAVFLLSIIPEHQYTEKTIKLLTEYIQDTEEESEKESDDDELSQKQQRDDRLEVTEQLTPVEVKGRLPEFVDVINGKLFEIPDSDEGDLLLVSGKAAEILKEKGGLGNPITK